MGSNGERSAQPAILSAAEVASWLPFTALPAPAQRKTRLRQQLLDSGCSTPAQAGGRRWATGCVSLEITQRCNRYALSLVVGDTVHDVNVDRTLTAKVLTHLGDSSFPRTDRRAARKCYSSFAVQPPESMVAHTEDLCWIRLAGASRPSRSAR